MLAALGGALIAPKVSVVPAMGVEVIVLAFAVVVIGGLGSLRALRWAPSSSDGTVGGRALSARSGMFSIYLVMALG